MNRNYVLLLLVFLVVVPVSLGAPTKGMDYYEDLLQEYMQETNSRYNSGGNKLWSGGYHMIESAHVSSSLMDMYFEGFGFIYGLTRAWQASGDFSYLDRAMDAAEADVDAAVNLYDFYESRGTGNSWSTPKVDYRGNILYPNYWKEKYNYAFPSEASFSYYFPDMDEFHTDPISTQRAYRYVTARSPNEAYQSQALGETIYYRFVADMLRVMYKHEDVLNRQSYGKLGNGRTYKERADKILAHLEENIYEKWVEPYSTQKRDSKGNLVDRRGRPSSKHTEWYVYRENTHMASHLPSVAISLYAITGKEKYRTFAESYFLDFGSEIDGDKIPSGIGFLDQIHYLDGHIVYSNQWGRKPESVGGDATAQDVGHGGVEYHLVLQAYEEGILPNRITREFVQEFIDSYVHFVIPEDDPCQDVNTYFRMDRGENGKKAADGGQGTMGVAYLDKDLLCHIEHNLGGGDIQRIGFLGHGMYAAKILVDGEEPAYLSSGVDIDPVIIDRNNLEVEVINYELVELGEDGFVVFVEFNKPVSAQILYGESGQLGQESTVSPSNTEHFIQVDGLDADTVYFFAVASQNREATGVIDITKTYVNLG